MSIFRRNTPEKRRPRVESDDLATLLPRLQLVADGLPGFGETPFLASLSRRPPTRVYEDAPYIRRILISWLIGRPVSQIARRAGCSTRLVYKYVGHFIYAEPEDLGWALVQWFELGLVAAIDNPKVPARWRYDDKWPNWFHPNQVTVACLVCHRLIGSLAYDHDERQHAGTWLEDPGTLAEWAAFDASEEQVAPIQGHLLCHFSLGHDPISRRVNSLRRKTLGLRQAFGTATAREERSLRVIRSIPKRTAFQAVISSIAFEIMDRFLSDPDSKMLPLKNGKMITLEEARRWWGGMLKS